MQDKEIYARLNEVFRRVFDDGTISVVSSTTSMDIDDWDSMEHIDLMAAVEKEFGVHFRMSEVSRLKNVGELVDIIKKRSK